MSSPIVTMLQRYSFGSLLIFLASAILLWSDAPRRPQLGEGGESPSSASNTSSATAVDPKRSVKVLKVGLIQLASQPIIDEAVVGFLNSLKQAGFVEGKNLELRRFNPEGDIATANAMALELTSGDYDLIVTLTTGALQAVANANKQRKIPHVFGLVTDPSKAGVGVGTEPYDHPPHMVGIGTLQPVAESFRMARTLTPSCSGSALLGIRRKLIPRSVRSARARYVVN